MAPNLFKIYLDMSAKQWYDRCGDVGPLIDDEQLVLGLWLRWTNWLRLSL